MWEPIHSFANFCIHESIVCVLFNWVCFLDFFRENGDWESDVLHSWEDVAQVEVFEVGYHEPGFVG